MPPDETCRHCNVPLRNAEDGEPGHCMSASCTRCDACDLKTGDVALDDWLFHGRVDGAHVHVDVRVGVEGQRALLGTLCMNEREWAVFRVATGFMGAQVRTERP